MAKQEVIRNVFDASYPQIDKYHLNYLKDIFSNDNNTTDTIIEAMQSKNREAIESVIREAGNRMKSSILVIGIACVIIDREALYAGTGYSSYLSYALSLSDLAGIPPQTLSDAKIIGEAFIDYFDRLKKVGFVPQGNAHKLRFLPRALENHPHNQDEVFRRVAKDSLAQFKEWAAAPETKEPATKEPSVKIEVTDSKIAVDGRTVLNFPKGLPAKEKNMLASYLTSIYKIRAVGNEPFVVSTYDHGEQRAIMNFLKQYRQKR